MIIQYNKEKKIDIILIYSDAKWNKIIRIYELYKELWILNYSFVLRFNKLWICKIDSINLNNYKWKIENCYYKQWYII